MARRLCNLLQSIMRSFPCIFHLPPTCCHGIVRCSLFHVVSITPLLADCFLNLLHSSVKRLPSLITRPGKSQAVTQGEGRLLCSLKKKPCAVFLIDNVLATHLKNTEWFVCVSKDPTQPSLLLLPSSESLYCKKQSTKLFDNTKGWIDLIAAACH